MWFPKRTLLSLPLLLAFLVPGKASAKDSKWEHITKEEGVEVWQRKIEGTSLVEFRGKGIIPASYKKILAVLSDDKRKPEWMERCVDARKLRIKGPGRLVMYNRTGSNVPFVSDRDIVMLSNTKVFADKQRIRIDIHSVEDALMPKLDGVVRMPKLKALWILDVKGPEKTEVTYQVQADPGGMIPKWVVNLVSKKLPLKTIINLRRQTKKAGYDKEMLYVTSAFDWTGFEGKPAQKAAPAAAPEPKAEPQETSQKSPEKAVEPS